MNRLQQPIEELKSSVGSLLHPPVCADLQTVENSPISSYSRMENSASMEGELFTALHSTSVVGDDTPFHNLNPQATPTVSADDLSSLNDDETKVLYKRGTLRVPYFWFSKSKKQCSICGIPTRFTFLLSTFYCIKFKYRRCIYCISPEEKHLFELAKRRIYIYAEYE